MRNLKMFLVIIFVFNILCSCEKKDDQSLPLQEPSDFIFKAERDNDSWEATSVLWRNLNKMDNILDFTSVMDNQEALRIKIDMEKILIGEKLRDFDADLSFIIGGDVFSLRYNKTMNLDNSYMIFSELDTINKRIKGKFEIELIDIIGDKTSYINFKNGEFSLDFKDVVN